MPKSQERMIVRMKFGSHLYGTNTNDSDIDYKGVFLPPLESILLNRIPKSYSLCTKTKEGEGIKNSPDDTDEEIYSLHYFIKLACEGQTVALDMLHAPNNMITECDYIWSKIVANREKFYTKNLKAFVSYARKQAAKYGIKGSRLSDAKRVLDFLDGLHGETKLFIVWESLPVGEHCKFIQDCTNGVRQYQVCGKIIQETATIKYAKGIITHFYNNYGRRAELAANNEGIDWKAVSHAMRAAIQVKEILTERTIHFPLKEAEYLKQVKCGNLDYSTEVVLKLEELMKDVEELSDKSTLPEKVDTQYWDKFIINIIRHCYQLI